MPTYAFPPAPIPSLAINGTATLFPVRRVYCIGRNYGAHAIEMGHDPDREAPFFFQKNPNNLTQGASFPYPPQTQDLHHEVEMIVALKSGGKNIPQDQALDHVFGYGIGLDMTRRDLQALAKQAGRPWEISKAFEASAPVSLLHPVSAVGHPASGRIELKINGTPRQSSDLNQMIWKVPEMIAYLSEYFELAAGDVIMTGTPAGVGPVQIGDEITCEIESLGTLNITVI